jgi:hypothetical protein
MSGVPVKGALDGIVSHALSLGLFERVNAHEPENAPGHGLTAAVWVQDIMPVPARSGLNSTSVRLAFTLRIYTSMLREPPDAIDPEVVAATDALMAAYTGDFELGGEVANIDLLGAHGVPLRAQAGYLPIDGKLFRIMDITVPVVLNDVWGQTP